MAVGTRRWQRGGLQCNSSAHLEPWFGVVFRILGMSVSVSLQGDVRGLMGRSDSYRDGRRGRPSWPALTPYLGILRNAKPGFQVSPLWSLRTYSHLPGLESYPQIHTGTLYCLLRGKKSKPMANIIFLCSKTFGGSPLLRN